MFMNDKMLEILKLVAPGTELREGLENILKAKTGALIVVSDSEDILKIADGGFKIDEEFTCEHCGKHVQKLGYSCRNHCPYCLHSKHVDVNPGDRAEECHGDLVPVGAEIDSKKGYVIIFKCKKCGKIRRNKAAEDDDMDLIIKLTAMHNY